MHFASLSLFSLADQVALAYNMTLYATAWYTLFSSPFFLSPLFSSCVFSSSPVSAVSRLHSTFFCSPVKVERFTCHQWPSLFSSSSYILATRRETQRKCDIFTDRPSILSSLPSSLSPNGRSSHQSFWRNTSTISLIVSTLTLKIGRLSFFVCLFDGDCFLAFFSCKVAQ